MSNVLTLDTVEQISKAIEDAKNPTVKAILETLLQSKKREVELAAKVAKKSSSRTGFTVAESIAKSLFVALRPHVDDDGLALRVFNAAVAVLSDNDLSVELQEKIFSTSTWHCAKSNFNKCVDISTAYNSYRESVKQAKVLLSFIEQGTWSDWEKAIIKAAKAAAAKRGETWLTPAEQAIKDAEAAEAADTEIVPAAADTEIVPAAADTEIVPAAADTEIVPAAADKKKVVITTRRGNTRGKNK